MAAATLVLGEPQAVTLESTITNLREVIIPENARSLLIDCSEDIYVEVDTGQSDAGAQTTTEDTTFPSGQSSWRLPGTGGGRSRKLGGQSLFIAPSATSSLVITLTAQAEG